MAVQISCFLVLLYRISGSATEFLPRPQVCQDCRARRETEEPRGPQARSRGACCSEPWRRCSEPVPPEVKDDRENPDHPAIKELKVTTLKGFPLQRASRYNEQVSSCEGDFYFRHQCLNSLDIASTACNRKLPMMTLFSLCADNVFACSLISSFCETLQFYVIICRQQRRPWYPWHARTSRQTRTTR